MKKVWKHLSLVVVAAMLLSLVACGTTPGTSASVAPSATVATTASVAPSESVSAGTSEATATPSTPPSADNMTPFTPYAEPITISVARITNRGQQLAAGETTAKNGQLDVIKKKLNVDIKIAWETAPQEYNQKLALSIAGGTLPDVFIIQNDNALTFRALVENGALADLTEAYNKCVGGLALEQLKAVNFKNEIPNTIDGKIYAINGVNNGYNYDLLWVRQDWLDKVKMPMPKTLDELKAVATAFVKNKLGGENTLGLPIGTDPMNRSDSFMNASPIANAVGSFPKSWIKGTDGKAIYGSIAPETKIALGILADWYKSGLLDKQFMTYKTIDDVTPRARSNETGLMFVGWWNGWNWVPEVAKYKYDWVPTLAPLNAEGKFAHLNPMFGGAGGVVVNAKFAHPEAVVKAINVEYEALNGMYDSDPEILAMLKPSRDAGSGGRTISPFSGPPLAGDFTSVPRLGQVYAKYCESGDKSALEGLTPLQIKDGETAYKFFKSQDRADPGYGVYWSFVKAGPLTSAPENVDMPELFNDTTESMVEFKANLDKLELEAFTQIISGQKPLDYFDEFVTQWKQQGGDQITVEVQAIVDKQQ